MEKVVGVAQLFFMPHPLLEIVQRLMAHPVLLEGDFFPGGHPVSIKADAKYC